MKIDLDTTCTGAITQDSLLSALIRELEQGVSVIESIDDITYRRKTNISGSVGAQFRHNLDFVTNLIRGIEDGRIDHSDRERDVRVETDREYAIGRFDTLISRLNYLNPRIMRKSVLVRSEVDGRMWLPSSVAREAEFVHSHTVHHHALIAEKLAALGIKSNRMFGVAPSTIEYWKRQAA